MLANVPSADLRNAVLAVGYDLGPNVGEGAFKVCYSAVDASGTTVAFKILKSNAYVDRTLRELAAMRDCNHPNIARCIDNGTLAIGPIAIEFVVEEFFEGGTLADRLTHGGLERGDAMRYGSDLLGAIGYLRDRRLVHRDIKPENLMFTSDGRIVLTDFGIVRALGEPSLTSTAQPYGWGTLGFMPAEQYFNQKPMIDWRADQFALGVTLSLAALSVHPFGADFAGRVQAIARRDVPTAIFEDVARQGGYPVLVKMVQPYPVQRYTDPEALLKDWAAQTN